jgi:carbonic anhydrase
LSDLKNILSDNEEWVKKVIENDEKFFSESSKGQSPKYLWIGCADSRVPPNVIMNLDPGEVFVHRNIANQANENDKSCQSVMQYAIEALGVQHILVCGHSLCGGVIASIGRQVDGVVGDWIENISVLYEKNLPELNELNEQDKVQRLCELNILQQVENVCNNSIVQNAWNNKNPLKVHGLLYDLKSGYLKELISHSPPN